jgi:hypothetical protein
VTRPQELLQMYSLLLFTYIFYELGLLNAAPKPGWEGYLIHQGLSFNPANIATT